MVRMQSTKFIYLDYFSLNFLFSNFHYFLNYEIIIIDDLSLFDNFIIKILNFFGFKIKELEFVVGHLTYDKENVFLKAREIAGKLSIDCSSDIVSSSEAILNLNKEFKDGTIELFISRYLQLNVEKWVVKILVIKTINKVPNSDFKIFLCKPQIFSDKIIKKYFFDLDLHFYSNNFFKNFKIYFSFITSKFSIIKFIYHSFKQKSKQSFNEQRSSVLCIQNDTIGLSSKRRRQPHWIEKDSIRDYNTYIMSFGYASSPAIVDEEELNNANCYVVRPSFFLESYKIHKQNKVLELILKKIKKSFFDFLKANSYHDKHHLLEINKLFLSSYLISAIAINLKTKVFIINEPQSIYSDALVLVSDKLYIKTIALQYSNMSMISPLMMSNASVFCLFSKMYESVFSYKNIKPEGFLVTGYLINSIKNVLIDESRRITDYFANIGVTFVISYFDENLHYGKWALYDDSDYIKDIEALAKSVVNNIDLGVIIKTQFIRNGPKDFFSNNVLINQAFDSGRLIEIKSGISRNDIYPAHVALASDLCIGHVYGATASLEAAVYGVRSVLINEFNMSTKWDCIYNLSHILFDSIDDVISLILANKYEISSIGDWKNIIDKFDYNQEFSSIDKINALVDSFLIDSPKNY